MNQSQYLIDTHAHLECYKDKSAMDQVIKESIENGVKKIVNASARVEDWNIYHNLAKEYPENLSWLVGIHPEEATEASMDYLDGLCSYFSSDAKPVGIGEIGLDYHYFGGLSESETQEKIAIQKALLKRQLEFAQDMDCPICIHARDAVMDTFDILKASGVDLNKVVFHCFSGNVEEIKILNDAGCRASFTGIITYKNAQEMRDVMLQQGLEKIMFETDCPYLAPTPHRSKTNYPAYTKFIAQHASELFGISFEEMAQISTQNAEDFYSIHDK
ncbi:MAG: TatD family hydrolase [Opitutales bacterium]